MSIELDICYRTFNELEAQRDDTLVEVSGWSTDCLHFRQTPGSWCAVEVLDHVVRAETETIAELTVGLLKSHILSSEARPGIAALDAALRSEEKFTVPPGAPQIHPDAQTTFAQVVERWDHTRGELGRLLKELSPTEASYGVFCHPFAGWMTFADVLEHFSAHVYHHRFQLARLQACTPRGTRSSGSTRVRISELKLPSTSL